MQQCGAKKGTELCCKERCSTAVQKKVQNCVVKRGAALRCKRKVQHCVAKQFCNAVHTANSTQIARARKKTGRKTEKPQPALVNVQQHRIKKQAGKFDLFFLFVKPVYFFNIPSSLPIFVKAATARSSCVLLWPAETCTRILARSLGTTG